MEDLYKITRDADGTKVVTKNNSVWHNLLDKKYKLLLKKAEIPQFYWDINFSDYKGEDSRDSFIKIKKYSEYCFQESKFDYVNLYLYSIKNGSQKTALMCNVGKEAIKQGKKVQFVLAGTLIDRLIKNQGFNYNADIESYLSRLKTCDMILIDDIFDTKKSVQWANSDLITAEWDRFLREMFVKNIKIVMTSNTPLTEISKKFGENIKNLIERNCIALQCNDMITQHRKSMFENLLD
jgi:DNA replication protein DnaC